MDQNQNQEQVLIARDNDTGQVGAVTGLNDDGTPRMTDVKSAKLSDLVKFSKGQNPLEAFLSNFMRQYHNPTRFGFFQVPADRYETVGAVISDLAQNPEANAEMLKSNKVELPKDSQEERKTETQETPGIVPEKSQESPKQGNSSTYRPFDESKLDWEAFKKNWGVEREQLVQTGDLEKMLNYGKSGLLKIQPTIADEKISIEARLSLRQNRDGNIKLVPHPVHLEPDLEKEYRGHQFTAADKEQLLKTGNLGRIVELNGKEGAKIPSYVSLDRLTNEIVSIPVERLKIRDTIGKTRLSEEEIATLRNGQPVLNKEVTLRDGKTFKTTLQVNADSRSVEFVPKAWQRHKQDTGTQQQRNSWTDENGNIRPIGKWKGIEFTEQQKQDYVNGKTVVLTNAVDKEGQPCTLYVRFDPKAQRGIGTTKNPDLDQTVAPSNESATQVAVNNDGKTNEATNKIREPLQKEQTAPKNNTQQKKQDKGPKL